MRNIEKAIYHTAVIILIGVVLYLLVYFFFPIDHGLYADGGTEYWKARMYTLVHWKHMGQSIIFDDGTTQRFGKKYGWQLCWYPNQDAWEEQWDTFDALFWEEYNEWHKKNPDKQIRQP